MARWCLLVAGLLAACTAAHSARAALEGDKAAALAWLEARGEQGYNQELLELVAIPSVSSLPEHQPDMLRAAAWLEARLKAAGLLNVQVLPNPKGPRPAVYAEHLQAGSGALTVLIYGHYDVQPAADTADLWASPPFQPEIRDGRIFGRGASDDKGSGVLPPIQALEAILAAAKGSLPLNVKVILEGEEEVGSPFLEPFLHKYSKLLAADYVLSADGGQISETQPAISLGHRRVDIETAATDVHSGLAGGAVQNPARALAQLLNTMWDPTTYKVTIDGFYDQVRAITDEDRDVMLRFGYEEEEQLLRPLGASAAVGEAGFTSLERLWLRPTLEVVGMGGGFQGEGIKTIVPRRAFVKLAARLVPDQTPKQIAALIEAHVAAHLPPGCNSTVRELGFSAVPYSMPKDTLPNRVAGQVLERLMGKPPLFERSGATIPALAAFQTHLNISTTVFAFGLPDCNMHAPNEEFRLSMYRLARRAWIDFLFELAAAAAAERGAGGGGAHSEL